MNQWRVVVECPGRKPDCASLSRSEDSRKCNSCWCTTFSTIFEITGRTEIGLKLLRDNTRFFFCIGVTKAFFQRVGTEHCSKLMFMRRVIGSVNKKLSFLINKTGMLSAPIAF